MKTWFKNRSVLIPQNETIKTHHFVPLKDAEKVRNAYSHQAPEVSGIGENCSFNIEGSGSFKGMKLKSCKRKKGEPF